MLKQNQRFLLAGLLLLMAVVYMFAKYYLPQSELQGQATSFSQAANGTSVMIEYLKKSPKNQVSTLLQNYLEVDLARFDLLTLVDPGMSLSKEEVTRLMQWVIPGGTVYINLPTPKLIKRVVEEEEVWMVDALPDNLEAEKRKSVEEYVSPYLTAGALGAGGEILRTILIDGYVRNNSIRLKVNPYYENLKSDSVITAQGVDFFPSLGEFEFYSTMVFDDPLCTDENRLPCYVKSIPVKKGQLVVSLGLSPLSNYFLAQSQNTSALFELEKRYSKIAIDEYRHFFLKKTMAEFLTEPSIVLPLLGLLVLTFLYLFFAFHPTLGMPKEDEIHINKGKESLDSLAARMNLDLLQNKNGRQSAWHYQISRLKKIFPEKKEKLDDIEKTIDQSDFPKKEDFLVNSQQLIKLHQKWNQERGIIK